MNHIWNSFFREMEKTAINPMSIAMYGMNLMNLKDKINQSNIATQLTPLNRQAASNLKLQSPYQYQFEGGKKTGLTETTTPHTF